VSDEIFAGDILATNLRDAKNWLKLRSRKGARCPCCNQYVKVYKRALNSSMSFVLIMLVRNFEAMGDKAPDRGFVHVPSFLNEVGLRPEVAAAVRGDWAKLAHWGLIEGRPSEGDKKYSGYWRPTFKGIDFAHGTGTMTSYR
jgi:hypothetical protein